MKKLLILALSFVMLSAFTAGTVMAKEKQTAKLEALSGEIVSVDLKAGKISVMIDKKTVEFKADPNMIKGFTTGQKVSLEKTGDILKSIKKA